MRWDAQKNYRDTIRSHIGVLPAAKPTAEKFVIN